MVDGPVVVVRGEAFREVPPELARFQVTATARDKDRQATLARLAERAEAVRTLIDSYGAAIERRESGQLQVYPEVKRASERVVAYHGSVSTTVTVTDFTVLGELMLRLADRDQTQIAGPWWELRPGSPVHREARRAAIGEAVDRAREYADALGARVTALVQLADAGTDQPRPMMMVGSAQSYRAKGAMDSVPELDLDPQPQSIQASVEARFTISEPTVLAEPGD
ncbi:SIMPL domain-containing protein [Micromonospora sp. NBC_01796]|uniref:SIMPL domain-containing protein n=1 Tax=Micromonospora sp. NBC_01796 TaxID=2975987 RepID=UPI002DD84C21|nr:SIMPL domain-containing protein [Micromonospora sp. NBC_01796]WSA89348.1 SIMPL domain-containing protein [Micromonospora sp. NBC_01796]